MKNKEDRILLLEEVCRIDQMLLKGKKRSSSTILTVMTNKIMVMKTWEVIMIAANKMTTVVSPPKAQVNKEDKAQIALILSIKCFIKTRTSPSKMVARNN